MKKFISVLLCLVMLFSMTAISASAADNLKIIVANDLHLSLKSYTPYTGNTANNAWAHVASSGQLILESNAIITAFLEAAATSSADCLLLPGDLVDTGSAEEHTLFAAKLAEFEKNTGKQVYVVPGNHDLFKTDINTFVSLYKDFGYGEAIAKNNASYVVNLANGYRLLAIDSTRPGESVWDISADEINWIKAQLDQAKADGKKVIAMMHHNLVDHFIFSAMIHPGAVVESENLRNILADGGVKFIFTGHTHDQDIASYTSPNGNVIYDVVTNTLNAYPCQYREVTFAKDVRFASKKIDKINTSLLPAGLSSEAVALAESDFIDYTKKTMWTGLRKTFTSYINASSLVKLLSLDPKTDPDMCRIISTLGDKLAELVQMPFYTENENGNSIQKIAAKYGKTIPQSKYTDLVELGITLYQAHCLGDENYPINSTEVNLLLGTVTTILCYCLEDVSAEDYTTALRFLVSFAGASVSENLLSFAGSTIKRTEGIDMIANLILRPLVVEFTTDDSPADNNLTLPGYRNLTGFEKFIQLLNQFIEKIINFFNVLFSFFRLPMM